MTCAKLFFLLRMPTPQLQQALQQQALQMQAMQQNAMASCGTNATMQAQQLQVPQMAPQMGQQMPGHMGPLQNPQMTMGPQTQLQLQQAPMQLPFLFGAYCKWWSTEISQDFEVPWYRWLFGLGQDPKWSYFFQ